MAQVSEIAWTDATFNPWEGCTKVGPGCDACYAEARNRRFTSGENWGSGALRRRTSAQTWSAPVRWNRLRAEGITEHKGQPVPLWVFCASLADVFDNEVPKAWRSDALTVISLCRNLRFQLVTKRIGNVLKMLPEGWLQANPHVGILATIVNQDEVTRDLGKLETVKAEGAKWVGVSVEPQIGRVDLCEALGIWWNGTTNEWVRQRPAWLDWIITGGESAQPGHVPRPYDLAWPRTLVRQGQGASVPVFVKQLGSKPVIRDYATGSFEKYARVPMNHSKGEDPSEWPMELRVREMPRVYDQEAAASEALNNPHSIAEQDKSGGRT